MKEISAIICLGKAVKTDGSLDWILRERVEKALQLYLVHPESKLILTGAKHHLDDEAKPSEAISMLNYLKVNYPSIDQERIVIEDQGVSTIHQLCKIKNETLIPQAIRKVFIVTDEIHIDRAGILAEWIFGEDFEIERVGSLIDIIGMYRDAMIKIEKEKYDLTIETIVNVYQKGDDKKIFEYEEKIRAKAQEHKSQGGSSIDIKAFKV